MKINRNFTALIASLIALSFLVLGCEYEGPEQLWDPNPDFGAQPTITTVLPSDSAAGGVSEIVIQGANFSDIPENNKIYIYDVANGNALSFGILKASSADEITIYRPNMVSDALTIKVSVEGAFFLAEINPYGITKVVDDYGIFPEEDFSSPPRVYCIAADAEENIYAASYANNNRLIYKFSASGELSEFATTSFRASYDMQIGPNGDVYVQRGKKYFDVFPADGSNDYEYGADMDEKARYFDFDENHNIYCGYKDGIFLLRTDETSVGLGVFNPDFEVFGIKVFKNEYVYVAAEYTGSDTNFAEMGVWRSSINLVDDLGEPEQVFDIADAGEIYADAEITSITLSNEGKLFVSVDIDDADPILVRYADGRIEPYYQGGIISPHAVDMVWSTDEVLYVNPGEDALSQNILAIDMGEAGAPYFGRD